MMVAAKETNHLLSMAAWMRPEFQHPQAAQPWYFCSPLQISRPLLLLERICDGYLEIPEPAPRFACST